MTFSPTPLNISTTGNLRHRLGWFLVIMVVVGISTYALFEFRHLLLGPQISIADFQDGALLTDDQVLEFKGFVTNASYLSINDNEVIRNIDDGSFSVPIILSGKTKIIKVVVKGKSLWQPNYTKQLLIPVYLTKPKDSTHVADCSSCSQDENEA